MQRRNVRGVRGFVTRVGSWLVPAIALAAVMILVSGCGQIPGLGNLQGGGEAKTDAASTQEPAAKAAAPSTPAPAQKASEAAKKPAPKPKPVQKPKPKPKAGMAKREQPASYLVLTPPKDDKEFTTLRQTIKSDDSIPSATLRVEMVGKASEKDVLCVMIKYKVKGRKDEVRFAYNHPGTGDYRLVPLTVKLPSIVNKESVHVDVVLRPSKEPAEVGSVSATLIPYDPSQPKNGVAPAGTPGKEVLENGTFEKWTGEKLSAWEVFPKADVAKLVKK